MEKLEQARDERPFSTNLLTLREKDEQDIIDAKRRVDAN